MAMTREERNALLLKGEIPEDMRSNHTFKMVLSLLSYLGCICITLAVTHYIDGTAGVILTAALICALVVSLAMTLLVSRFISVEAYTDKAAANKNDTVTLTVKLSKKIFVPSPIIEMYAYCGPQLSAHKGTYYKAALAGREVNSVEIPFTAKHSGAAELGIREVRLTDYLGIFSFRLKSAEGDSAKVAVYPDIPDAAVQTDFLKTTSMFANNDDDDEESDETSMTPTGLAGYEHRKYVPGDPIKRINWKLSSKKDEYMVRLDERIAGAGQMFFLDVPECRESDYTLAVRDNVIEGALAVFTMLIREGREATFFFPKEGVWNSFDVRAMGDVYYIQEQLGDFRPCAVSSLIPEDITSAGKVPICFTSAVEGNSGSAVRIASASADAMLICSLASGLAGISSNMWTVSDEFEFKKQK